MAAAITNIGSARWAPEAEQHVLGAVLLDNEALAIAAAAGLESGDFHDERNGVVWSAMLQLRERGEAIDPVTVCEVLRSEGQEARCGGLQYLGALVAPVTSSRAVASHARLIIEKARRRQLEAGVDALREAVAGPLSGDELLARIEGLAAGLAHLAGSSQRPPGITALFKPVELSDIEQAAPAPLAYWWGQYMAAGVVTILGAHGGIGKSMLALMLGVCIALGRPFLGLPTKLGRVLFYSAEDGEDMVRGRLQWICFCMNIDPCELVGRLHVLDAASGAPVLFHEVMLAGSRQGLTTPSFTALADYIEEHTIDVALIDNASDVYDASEIERAKVSAFMRALTMLAQKRGLGLMLLMHVDKGTSRGERAGSEGYSGSTGWHNKARSRLFLSRDKDGSLLLEHQKNNLGKLCEPLRLVWPEHGLPQVDEPVSGVVQRISEQNDIRTLLRLLDDANGRGEFVSTSRTSPANVARALAGEPGLPRRKPAELLTLMRDAERAELVKREAYRSSNRKPMERWAITPKGCTFIGKAAPSAPTAPTYEGGARG